MKQDPDDITWWSEFSGDRLWWLYMPAESPDQMYSEVDSAVNGTVNEWLSPLGWNLTDEEEHICEGTDGDYIICFDGRIYGPCDWEDDGQSCSGACICAGDCECSCHGETSNEGLGS